MNLYDILTIKFPFANMLSDIILQDDGNGPYIKEWKLSDKKPSKEEIESWGNDAEITQAYKEKQNFLKRQEAYPSITELTLALWEKTILNDDTKALELQAKREAIQAEFPKSSDDK